MSRLIDADLFWKVLCENAEKGLMQSDSIEEVLNRQPTIDAEPVRHGKWIYIDDGDERYATYRCSHCHQEVTVDAERICDIGFVIEDLEYCPQCGCKMDEVTE